MTSVIDPYPDPKMGINIEDSKHERARWLKKAELYTMTKLPQYASYACVSAIPHIHNKIY